MKPKSSLGSRLRSFITGFTVVLIPDAAALTRFVSDEDAILGWHFVRLCSLLQGASDMLLPADLLLQPVGQDGVQVQWANEELAAMAESPALKLQF